MTAAASASVLVVTWQIQAEPKSSNHRREPVRRDWLRLSSLSAVVSSSFSDRRPSWCGRRWRQPVSRVLRRLPGQYVRSQSVARRAATRGLKHRRRLHGAMGAIAPKSARKEFCQFFETVKWASFLHVGIVHSQTCTVKITNVSWQKVRWFQPENVPKAFGGRAPPGPSGELTGLSTSLSWI